MKQFNYFIFSGTKRSLYSVFFFLTASLLLTTSLYAQPANDDCDGLIDLGEVPLCPSPDIYTNVGASMSNVFTNPGDNIPDCFSGNADRDVWFSFNTPTIGGIIDFEIFVTGVSGVNGSILQPQVALYRGDCELDGLAELDCISAEVGETEVELEVLGLTPNTTYFLRINDWSNSASPNDGDFVLCIQEYEENMDDPQTPDDLPWEVNATCGSIVSDGIAAVSCGVGAIVPNDDQWVFGLMNMNSVMPNFGRIDVTNDVEMYHHPSWHVDSIGNVFGITMDYSGNIYTTASSNYGAEFFNEPSVLKYGAIGGGENDIQAAGTVYILNGISGQASVFTVLPQQNGTIVHNSCEGFSDIVRNTGPGLGNITFSPSTQQFYATNLEDGRIYRLDDDGNILDSYDPLLLDNGFAGTVSLDEMVYGIDISPDGSQLFFGNSFSFSDDFGGGASVANIYSIDLNADGSFIGSIDNSSMPSGANWDNYTGNETLHFEVVGPDFSFLQSQLIITDLEFTTDGNLLVGCRSICQNNIHTSYNHDGRAFVLSQEPVSGLFSNEDGIIYSGNPFSLGQSSEAYGGVSSFIDEDGSVIYATSSADMLEEEGPHGIHLSNTGSYGSQNNPTSPAGIIAYSSDPILQDPKGVGGDITFFKACEQIVVAECGLESVDAGEDITICAPGENITLNGTVTGEFTGVTWTPSDGLSDPNSLNPTVFVSTTTTYTLTAQGTIGNVIENGDFSDGDTGFTSEYVVGMGGPFGQLSFEGTYAVTPNSSFVHNNFAACTDNTGGGNMMVVNGATAPNEEIWCQTVDVTPNTDYEFSTWATSVIASNPAILQFSINGNLLGSPFNVSPFVCQWNQFFEVWNSGNNTTAEICITNQNTLGSGNDFAIDDITFSPVCFLEDEVTVTVLDPVAEVVPMETLTCFDSVISLDGTASSTGDGTSYLWTTINGNILFGETTLEPFVDAPGTYTLTVLQIAGQDTCSASADVIVIQEDVELNLPDSIVLCPGGTFTFDVPGFDTYEWSPADFLSCTDCPNPTATATETITYTLTATTADSCSVSDNTTIVVLPAFESELNFEACVGNTITYEGTELEPGSTTDFTFTAQNGCDSIVTVIVDTLPNFTSMVELTACTGTTVTYEGTELQPGSSTDFTFTAQNGCDSIVTVIVEELENFTSTVNLTACTGTTATYEGTELQPGSTTDFTFTAQNGCDSVVTVIVEELENFASTVNLTACEGTTATYEGTELQPGSSTDFTFTAQNGCDSIVTVIVEELENFASTVNLTACEGTTATYEGTELQPGSSTDFTFTAQNGCDSIVTVIVEELDNFASTVNLTACEGTTATYEGTELQPGSMTDFTFTAQNGCDSIVTVIVEELDNFASTVNLTACEGTTAIYEGTELQPGSTTDFTFTAQNGCDSIVTVIVEELDNFASTVNLTACEGTTATYEGTELQPGSTTDFTFIAQNGCDSIVTVIVETLFNVETAETITICPEGIADIFGEMINTPGVYDMVFVAANGCDSTHTITLELFESPQISTITSAPVSCFGGSDGSASVVAEGGLAPYTYLWSTGDETDNIENQAAGDYSVTITDANGCTVSGSITIEQPTDLTVEIMSQNVGCDEPGFAIANADGGTAPYTYEWDNGMLTAENLDILAGTYTVTATDDNGCTATTSVEITGGFGPEIEIVIDARPSQGDLMGGALSLNIESGTPPFSYDWSNGADTPTVSGLTSGEYNVIVTDANGCTDQASIQIFEFGCIGGVVWNDLNRDGCQSFGEIDLSNIDLNILGTDIFNNLVEASTTTDASGMYLFDSLAPGNYTIEVIPISGYQLSPSNNCGDDDQDSDFNVFQMSVQVSLPEGDCPKNIDAGIFDECLNILDPGAICCDQVLCGPGNTPEPITSLELPSGGEGPIEYMWIQGTAQGISGSIFYTGIPNSNSPDYAPGPLTETTYFARCARTAGCGKWLETTTVKITVEDVAVAAISAQSYVCVGDVTIFEAPDNDPDALYFWDFGPQASPSQSNAKTVEVTWTNVGLTNVTLTVIHDGCVSTDSQQVVVSNTAALCPNFLQTDQPNVESKFIKAELQYNVYPNPVNDQLNITWDTVLEEELSISLMTISGIQLQSSRVDGTSLNHQMILYNIPAGVYILQIRQANGATTNLKVIKSGD